MERVEIRSETSDNQNKRVESDLRDLSRHHVETVHTSALMEMQLFVEHLVDENPELDLTGISNIVSPTS